MVIRYAIRDASGRHVATHRRIDGPAGKRFTWELPDGRSGLDGIPVAELPLYGIDRLGKAATIVLVEGEKVTDALIAAGIPAVGTVTGAAATPEPAVLAELTGRRVLCWPDADEVGQAHMARIAATLTEIASSVRIVVLPDDVPQGWDAADAIAERRDLAALLAEPEPPSLAAALSAIEGFLRRFVVLARPEAYVAVVLWIAHTYAIEAADATGYLAVSSPEKQSGKTRLLECLRHLAHGATGITITPTAATIYRSLEATPGATLLLDELDAVFRDHTDRYEEVRAVINAGHRRGATVPRSVPGPKNTWSVKQFPVFGPKALAGIGKLPDTIADRSIPIRMVKRKRSEPVERFRERDVARVAATLVADLTASLTACPPAPTADVPLELADRAADAWEPLLAIADAAGGDWPARARRAALVLQANRERDDSLGLRLLADARLVFEARGVERIATAGFIDALQADPEGPWTDERRPLTAHRLAGLLRPFEITSRQLRIGEVNVKGYARDDFLDSWERYLSIAPSPTETKHRNTDPARRFDVSDRHPPDGAFPAEPGEKADPTQHQVASGRPTNGGAPPLGLDFGVDPPGPSRSAPDGWGVLE
jgi:hypothetical protein